MISRSQAACVLTCPPSLSTTCSDDSKPYMILKALDETCKISSANQVCSFRVAQHSPARPSTRPDRSSARSNRPLADDLTAT